MLEGLRWLLGCRPGTPPEIKKRSFGPRTNFRMQLKINRPTMRALAAPAATCPLSHRLLRRNCRHSWIRRQVAANELIAIPRNHGIDMLGTVSRTSTSPSTPSSTRTASAGSKSASSISSARPREQPIVHYNKTIKQSPTVPKPSATFSSVFPRTTKTERTWLKPIWSWRSSRSPNQIRTSTPSSTTSYRVSTKR